VIDRLAHRFAAAHILRAGISALILYTGLVARTIRAEHAFRMTTSYARRNSLQSRQTFANCRVSDFLAESVRPAR
jgi:hypothetical protein